MMENWNPLGIVGVITAFNFPCAVFGWNACIGLVCGDLMLWKGAPSTPLVSIATTKIFADVLKENGFNSVVSLCQGDGVEIGELISNDHRVPLVSFTGSTKVGRIVNQAVSKRFGKCILELGGNNAVIIMEDGNVDMALKACAFSAVGTAGQRCTTLRRIYLQETVYDGFVEKLTKAYSTVKIGDPLEASTLMGPLHSKMGVDIYTKAIETIKAQGGKILTGGNIIEGDGNYVEPTIWVWEAIEIWNICQITLFLILLIIILILNNGFDYLKLLSSLKVTNILEIHQISQTNWKRTNWTTTGELQPLITFWEKPVNSENVEE